LQTHYGADLLTCGYPQFLTILHSKLLRVDQSVTEFNYCTSLNLGRLTGAATAAAATGGERKEVAETKQGVAATTNVTATATTTSASTSTTDSGTAITTTTSVSVSSTTAPKARGSSAVASE
jgi:hypothetical protein